jgi:murein DD-endopeptidase MepM/ murein hydrolase activator NlpD
VIPLVPNAARPGLALLLAATIAGCRGAAAPAQVIPEHVDCAVFPERRTSAYVLPYQVGARFQVSRTFSHYLVENGGVGLYAIDLPMPIGTTVVAIRAGQVVAVEERFSDDDPATYHENWVMVRHQDSTVARYIHLKKNGADVDVGERVEQGQPVGRSGASGSPGGPHLHLDVQRCGPNLPPGYNRKPCGYTVPLSFRNTTAESCGLRDGRSYLALPFVKDLR